MQHTGVVAQSQCAFVVEIFGDAGRHTRIAVGVNALPYDVAVEVEAMFEIEG